MSTKYKHGDRVPSKVLASRLGELVDAIIAGKEQMDREFTRRIPAELDRDADCVMALSIERIIELEARLEAAERERDELRGALSSVFNEMPHRESRQGNAPGHAHSVPGIWDSDNGALAGKPCGWCAVWAAAERLTKEPVND